MVSSGMLRRVAFVITYVSQERMASFIRVTRIGELGTTLAVTSNRRTLRRYISWSHHPWFGVIRESNLTLSPCWSNSLQSHEITIIFNSALHLSTCQRRVANERRAATVVTAEARLRPQLDLDQRPILGRHVTQLVKPKGTASSRGIVCCLRTFTALVMLFESWCMRLAQGLSLGPMSNLKAQKSPICLQRHTVTNCVVHSTTVNLWDLRFSRQWLWRMSSSGI
jgi:hypothetical protein